MVIVKKIDRNNRIIFLRNKSYQTAKYDNIKDSREIRTIIYIRLIFFSFL